MIRCELSSHWQERQICSERFVSAAIHNADAAFLLDLPNYRAGRGCVTWFKDTYLNTVVQEIGTEIWKQQIVPLVTLYQDKVLPLVNLPASLCLLRDLTLVIPCQLLYPLPLLVKPENMGKFELKYSLKSVMEVVVWKKGKHGDYLYYVNYKNVLMESLWNTCAVFLVLEFTNKCGAVFLIVAPCDEILRLRFGRKEKEENYYISINYTSN